MGGGNWDSGQYQDAARTRAATGQPDFDHDQKVRTGQASGIHSSLDPRTVAGALSPLAGQNVRESRDSDEHPESLPVAVFFDVTGSMGSVPQMLQKKLATLMDTIIAKVGIRDAQVLVGAIGDATCDRYPFQVGQFESDNRFDEALRQIILEGGGGGQVHESYALAYRFAAYHTATDSFEKRGKKGYLITMGDEKPWPTVSRGEVSKIFGVEAETDEKIEDLISKAHEKWELYHICFVAETNHGSDPSVHKRWQELLGERFVKLEDSEMVCETIAGLIHILETAQDLDKVMDDIGLKGANATSVRNALVPLAKSSVPAHVAQGNMPTVARKSGGISRV